MRSRDIIHNARARAGLTQAELAARLGKTQSEVGRWERGDVEPSFETLVRIVRACGFDLVAQITRADDSYDAQIDRALELPPVDRVRLAAARAMANRRLRVSAGR